MARMVFHFVACMVLTMSEPDPATRQIMEDYRQFSEPELISRRATFRPGTDYHIAISRLLFEIEAERQLRAEAESRYWKQRDFWLKVAAIAIPTTCAIIGGIWTLARSPKPIPVTPMSPATTSPQNDGSWKAMPYSSSTTPTTARSAP